MTRNTGILRLRILSSGVQWIISEQFRGSRFVLMQRSVMQITFPIARISMNHQLEFMKNFEKQDGVAFLLIYFSRRNELYYMRCARWNAFGSGGKPAAERALKGRAFEALFSKDGRGICTVS